MYADSTKHVILKMYKAMKNEKQKGSLAYRIHKPLQRTCFYTGIKASTLRKWIKGKRLDHRAKSKRNQVQATIPADTLIACIRQMNEQRDVITLKKLMCRLSNDYNIAVRKTTLWRTLKANGFSFKRTKGNRRVLCRRPDLKEKKQRYLNTIKSIRAEGTFKFVALDETAINANHTYPKEWISNDGRVGRLIPTGKGKRLVLLHAAHETGGFIRDAELLFKSHSTDGRDYHKEMNASVFEDYVEHRLLPALTEPTVVMFDNAPYHSRVEPGTAAPTTASRKDEIKKWLTDRNIAYNQGSLKPELYALVKDNKPDKEYVVDNLIKAQGHIPLRTPPMNCELNPIEELWGMVKNYVARRNSTFKLKDMQRLTKIAIQNISKDTIRKTFARVIKIEDQMLAELQENDLQ